jgi:hypothetical protein
VSLSAATHTQRYQVVRHIAANLAPVFQVMNPQILRVTAVLASPTITFQYLSWSRHVFFSAQF